MREEPSATPQHGEPVLFKRRTQAQSSLGNCPKGDENAWYDQIRMLDSESCPHAFLKDQGMRLEFCGMSQRGNRLNADVEILPISTR